MFYKLKAVYNPLEEDITILCPSPITNKGEEYVIKSKSISLFPESICEKAANQISREVLRRGGKEFDDPDRETIETEILSHNFEIKDISVKAVKKEEKEAK